jgi:GntR family transcriptional repressor for pyruvate dehydrogenase complex
MFVKANPVRAFEDIARQIRQAILSGELKPGDRLPSQRELAKTFGVGRATLLAGLRIIEQEGLIFIKPGASGGAFVAAPDIEQVSKSLDLLFRREGVSLQELVEFREVLEGECAFWAVERASDSELASVRELVEELRAYSSSPQYTWQGFLKKEIEVHLKIAGLSHNRVALAVLQAIHATTIRFVQRLSPAVRDRILEDWAEIVKPMCSRQSRESASRLRQHILHFNQLIVESAAEAELGDSQSGPSVTSEKGATL